MKGQGSIMKFGEKVKDLREQRKMTQEELSKAAGISLRTVQYYEQGTSYPRNREIYSTLAGIFEVDINYLLTEDEEFLAEAVAKYGRRGRIQAEDILEQAHTLFAGGELSEEDRLAFVHEIQQLYFDSKERAREKFTPHKYRKNTDGE